MKFKKLVINTLAERYPIIIGNNLVSKAPKIIKENSIFFKKCLLVIDKNISLNTITKLKNGFKNKKIHICLIKANEKNKNLNTTNKIVKILLDKNFSRQDCLITIGGGITGDIGGFAASLFKRGIQFINIPTTLLSQVDSSIGGKTGVNSIHGKNLIGSFYQPKLVISDINFLKTLPKREIVCGYGEILKHSLILNKKFYGYLTKNSKKILKLQSPFIEKSIHESCKIKKQIVEKDEKEKNLRKILNFGHTFAHSYEASLGFSKKLNHGEAVILGIKTAIKFSYQNKILNKKDFNSINEHLRNAKLPFDLKKYFSIKDLNKIISFMIKDKKNISHKINLILLKKIGLTIIHKQYNIEKIKHFLKKELYN
jgi:3-dehydroquinate synthase/shikimate kinase/3-dehydroquinate synthase